MKHTMKRAAALLTIAIFLTTGCTSMISVPLTRSDQTVAPDVKVGESVLVTKKDGTKQKFTVLKIEDDALVGHNVRVNYSEMAAIEVRRNDGAQGHKAMLIGGLLLGAVAVAVATGGGHGGGGGY